jgi:Asp-tRNA(Asn)/Glu-tRNA(Gln) amidotransferase A subunit family amidase
LIIAYRPTSVVQLPELRSFLLNTAAFKSGISTPTAFLEQCLAAIEEKERDIAAFVALDIERARKAAADSTLRWRAGAELSPIDGMPIGVKDIMETASMPTAEGSPLFEGRRTNRDAAAVAALRAAGAIVLGKTVTTEFAAVFPGPTRNPWDLHRTPGGSSSGSAAAVGCGMIPVGLGTQVIGSTIRPASFCGCYGFKPSVHALNRGGSFDVKSHSVTTVLAASLQEAWVVARQIALRAGGDYGHAGLQGPMDPPSRRRPDSIIVLETAAWETVSEASRFAFEKVVDVLRDAGIRIYNRRISAVVAAAEDALLTANSLAGQINIWEDQWPLNTYARDMDASKLSEVMRRRLQSASDMSQEKYGACLRERATVRRIYETLATVGEACLTLSASGPAPVGLGSTGDPSFAIPASLLGVPAVSVPGMLVENLPVGLQLMGFRGKDSSLFSVAAFLDDIVAQLSVKRASRRY